MCFGVKTGYVICHFCEHEYFSNAVVCTVRKTFQKHKGKTFQFLLHCCCVNVLLYAIQLFTMEMCVE